MSAFRTVIARSPNFDARPAGARIDMLVLHYTGMRNAEGAIDRLCDPEAKVSAHYTIDTKGCVYAHVDEAQRAWHAGASFWRGTANVNARSIGIELVNPGHALGYVPFTDDQIDSLIALARGILGRHPIPAGNVVGHSDVAPMRKCDPGELFPWRALADAGIGQWPSPCPSTRAAPTDDDVAARLAAYGYGLPPQAEATLESVIAAFQRHFHGSAVTGLWDEACDMLLAGLPVEPMG